jgi:hypothetical protein
VANLSDRAIAGGQGASTGTIVWGARSTDTLAPWSLQWRIGKP